MRAFFCSILIFCWVNIAFCQTFNAIPDPLFQQEVQLQLANECYIHFDNPNGDSLQLHWRLVETNQPAGWDIDLCDYGTCYIGIPSNGLMNPVYDTIQAYIKLIVQPDTFPGSAWIWFRVYEEGNSTNFVEVFYSLYTPGTLSSHEEENIPLTVYPNPATTLLYLENHQDASVFAKIRNINGTVLWQDLLQVHSNHSIQVDQWPSGHYWLQYGSSVQKIIISH